MAERKPRNDAKPQEPESRDDAEAREPDPAPDPKPEPLNRDDLDVHAQAIWDNTEALPEQRIVGMYRVDDSLSKDEMVQEVVRRYLRERGDAV